MGEMSSRGGYETAEWRQEGPGDVPAHAPAGAIVLATGSPLLWEPLLGHPLLAWSVAAFERAASIADIVLVVPPDRIAAARQLASQEGWRKVRASVAPAQSWPDLRPDLWPDLRAGLETLDLLATPTTADGLVVVHEAARPLVTPKLIAAALAAARHDGAAVGAEPVKETIKRVQGGLVVATLPRERLVSVQTPAVLACARLRALLEAAPATLDAVLDVEPAPALVRLALAHGLSIATYPSSPENLRIATADDLAVAEALLRRRGATGDEVPAVP